MKPQTILSYGSILLAGLWLLPSLQAATGYDSSYTSIKAADCKTLSADEAHSSVLQRCQSFRNIGVKVLEGDLRQSVTLVRNGRDYPLNFWIHVTQGFSTLGHLMEWRHVKGQPGQLVGMIVRLTASEDADPEKTTSYLVVSKVTASEICVVGKVGPQVRENQNVKARSLAERAAQLPCMGG